MDTEELTPELADPGSLVDEGDEKDARLVYEIGYHLVPTLSEESVSDEVAPLRSALEKADATIVGEREPVRVALAYAI